MNTQQEMMKILQATNAYYTPPIDNGWEISEIPTHVTARHNASSRNFYFSFNPETKVIKAEAFCIGKPGSIAIYTGTISLGGHLIAPDMILALHTLFSFNFASDETFVVENNRAKKIPPAKVKKKFSIASDDSLAANSIQAPTAPVSSSLWDEAISTVPIPSKFSKFVRRIVYPSFRRSHS